MEEKKDEEQKKIYLEIVLPQAPLLGLLSLLAVFWYSGTTGNLQTDVIATQKAF